MNLLKYAIFTMYTETNTNMIHEFEDSWVYKEGDKIFFQGSSGKRLFVVNHVTHDVMHDGSSLHRLYCQEKKAHS